MSKSFPIMRAGAILVLGVFVALLISIVVPNWPRSRHSKINAIENNLRQLAGAVEQWAIDHQQTGAVRVTKEDIAPYLRVQPDHWVKQVAGERYILTVLPQLPEVVLTREVDGRPKGTVIRATTNGTFLQFILPNKAD